MEDRSPTGVLLEMANCTDAKALEDFNAWYERTHIPDMVATGALYKGLRFENCKPNRPEYPRRVKEAKWLTVYETDWQDSRKAYDAVMHRWEVWKKSGRLHPALETTFLTMYRRRPEPGQGHLSEKPINGINLVLVRGDEDFHRWGKFVHIRWIAEVDPPGYTMITRYENAVSATEGPNILHLYEMVSDDHIRDQATFPKLVEQRLGKDTPAMKDWQMHPSLEIWYVNSFKRVSA
ncbi:MAG: hypothetical protein HY261_07570 [Chloroflexi bacterium]|nr:hypothetical protein [Chloroflexota bacterium]